MSGLHLISEKDGATELINLQPHTPLKVKSLILKLLTIFLTELHIQKELLLLDNLCVLLENKVNNFIHKKKKKIYIFKNL
jgi:hypothetical protein